MELSRRIEKEKIYTFISIVIKNGIRFLLLSFFISLSLSYYFCQLVFYSYLFLWVCAWWLFTD